MISYQMQRIHTYERGNCGCIMTEDHTQFSYAIGNLCSQKKTPVGYDLHLIHKQSN